MFKKLEEWVGCRVILRMYKGRLYLGDIIGILHPENSVTYKILQLNNQTFGFFIDQNNTIDNIIAPHDESTPIIFYQV